VFSRRDRFCLRIILRARFRLDLREFEIGYYRLPVMFGSRDFSSLRGPASNFRQRLAASLVAVAPLTTSAASSSTMTWPGLSASPHPAREFFSTRPRRYREATWTSSVFDRAGKHLRACGFAPVQTPCSQGKTKHDNDNTQYDAQFFFCSPGLRT